MHINPGELSATKSHHMLRNLVMPGPIALVSTVNTRGLTNVAPFSFYGVLSTQPPILGIAIGRRRGEEKDTLINVMKYDEWRRK